VLLPAEEIAEQAPTLALWNGEHSETKIDDLDRSSMLKMPSVASASRK
jgi:hypothetical protein